MNSIIDHERIRPDRADFRRAMGRFCTGVTVVACGSGSTTEAMTANSLVSVSLDPLLLLVSVRTAGRLHRRLNDGENFSVSVLAEDQGALAGVLGRSGRPSGGEAWCRLGSWRGHNGAALAAGSLAAFECSVEAAYRGGDHTLFLGRVTDVHHGRPAQPLLFWAGGYPKLADQLSVPAPSGPHEVENVHV